MEREKPLSNKNQEKITTFKECGLPNNERSRRLKGSSAVIDDFI